MATSLLHALLEAAHGYTEADFYRLPAETRRLLRAELYEALNRDDTIMPLLVKLIKDQETDDSQKLFGLLKARVIENFKQVKQSGEKY